MIFSLAVSMGVLIWLLVVDLHRRSSRSRREAVHEPAVVASPRRQVRVPAILATLYIAVLVLLFSVPIGVGTAIYIEEYANKERWYNRFLEVNIQNLAAVPAIVYGILGLAFIVRGIGVGRVLLAGALDPHARRPPDRDHRLERGASRRARLDPAGRLRARRDEVAGDLAAGPAGLDSRDRDGLDPRTLARGRRDRAAAPDRGTDVRRVRSDDPRPVHRPPGADLHLGQAARRRVPGSSPQPRSSCCSRSCSA